MLNCLSHLGVHFISFSKENEAHYLCALLNSEIVNNYISSFSSAGRGFGAPSIVSKISIPPYDEKQSQHRALADISRECHKESAKGNDKELVLLEEKLNILAAKLWE